jgi:hypothetical protein
MGRNVRNAKEGIMEESKGQEISQGYPEQEALGLVRVENLQVFEVVISTGWSFKINKNQHEMWVEILNATYSEELSFTLNNEDDLNRLTALFQAAK